MTKWIKCSERLPGIHVRCIVHIRNMVTIGHRTNNGGSNKAWCWVTHVFKGQIFHKQVEVDYWMEIPPPPSKEMSCDT
jgi:hypothetical protein